MVKGKVQNPLEGTTYEGALKDFKKNGEGTFILPNGDKYKGSFVGDRYEG